MQKIRRFQLIHLQPMYWHDNRPVIGVDIDRNGIGNPPASGNEPGLGFLVTMRREPAAVPVWIPSGPFITTRL